MDAHVDSLEYKMSEDKNGKNSIPKRIREAGFPLEIGCMQILGKEGRNTFPQESDLDPDEKKTMPIDIVARKTRSIE